MRRPWVLLLALALATTGSSAAAASAARAPVAAATAVTSPAAGPASATGQAPAVSQAQALAGVRALFPQVAQMGQPSAQLSPTSLAGHPTWQFQWSQPGPRRTGTVPAYMAMVDATTGEVVDAHLPSTAKPPANPVALAQAHATAAAFLKRAAGAHLADLAPAPPPAPFSGGWGPGTAFNYIFRWIRQVNGIPVADEGANVSVDALTGQVTGYDLNWNASLHFPAATGMLAPSRAASAALDRIGLVLAYVPTVPNPPAGSPLKLHPVWELASQSGFWDAGSGGLLPDDARLAAGAGQGPAPATLTASGAPPQGGVAVTQAQAKATAAAVAKAAGYGGWTYQSNGQGETYGPGGVTREWSVAFAPPGQGPGGLVLSVDVSQATGQVLSLFVPSHPSSAQPTPATVEDASAAETAAKAFLKVVAPKALSESVLQVRPSAPGASAWSVVFVRLYDGIPVTRDTTTVTVDTAGRVSQFFRNSYTLTAAGAPVQLVGAGTARSAFAARQATLVYQLSYQYEAGQSPQVTPHLAYTFRNARGVFGPLRLDAVGGKTFSTADGEPADAAAAPPARIRGSWAELELWALSAQHLLPPDATPGGTVTRGQALLALVQELGLQQAGFSPSVPSLPGVPPASPYFAAARDASAAGVLAPGQPPDLQGGLTRQALVTWIVRALGYGGLISMPNRVASTFADAGSLAPGTANAVGIAQGLGIVTGYPGGAFHPQAPVSWAELAAMLFRASRLPVAGN